MVSADLSFPLLTSLKSFQQCHQLSCFSEDSLFKAKVQLAIRATFGSASTVFKSSIFSAKTTKPSRFVFVMSAIHKCFKI